MMCELSQHFDFLIESCQVGMIKPEPQIYKFVLDSLKAKPNEVCRCSLLGERVLHRSCNKGATEFTDWGAFGGMAAQS